MSKEIRSRFFANNPRFKFLENKDKYLFTKEKPQLKFNVIGTGTIGQEHMFVTTLEGRASIHGIYDQQALSIATAQKEYAKYAGNELVVYDSLIAACSDAEVDALIICTPNYTHIDILKVAVRFGKPILLEKPMASTLEDAIEITRIARNYDTVLQIGLQYRYKSMYVEALHEALERHSLGDVKFINMLEHRPPFLDKVGQWNKLSKFSGGTLVEKCCHYFDLINLIAQSVPSQVYATGSAAVNFRDFEYDGAPSDIVDNAFVTIKYENGIRAGFNINMFSPLFHEELTVCGDEGRLVAFEKFDFFHRTTDIGIELHRGDNGSSKVINPRYSSDVETSGHHGSTYYEHEAFVNAILGQESVAANVEQGFMSVLVGLAAEASLKSGQPVDTAPMLAQFYANR